MDKPKDDIQLVPVTDDTEQSHMSNDVIDSTAPLMADEKQVMFKDTVEVIEDREFDKEAICEMLTSDSDKFIPLLQNTNLQVYKFADDDTVLHFAAMFAGEEMMEKVLANKGELDFDSENSEKYNILHSAVDGNNEKSLVVILKWITKLKEENESIGEMLDGESGDDCNTPLHLAYENKNYKIMFELVKAGADPSVTNDFVFNTLHYAALADDLDAIQAVVDGAREGGEEAEGKLQQGRNSTDFNGLLPAMNTENKEIIKLLLPGVDLSNESCHEEYGSMLHFACDQNKPNLAKYLIANGAPLNTENSSGFTPLCIVAHRGYNEVGTALLEGKADPNLLLTESKLCPLNYAAQYGRSYLVRELVKYGAITNRSDLSKSIMYSAVFGGYYDVTKFLLEDCGCNADIYDAKGDIKQKPLCIAIEGGHISIIKLLLQHGVSPVGEVESHERKKPIHIAIKNKQRQALQILLEHGANPDDKTSSGVAPAQLAVDNDASTLLTLLLSYGISFTKRDCYGNTLLHAIASSGAVRCAECFLQYLSENYYDQIQKLLLEETDSRGRTPVDRAVDEGNESVLIEFFKHLDSNYFIEHPSLYHKLIEKNLFEALYALMNMSVYEKYLDVTLTPKFLDSISSVEHPYPDDPLYDRLEPSFMHKLLDCPDPLVKYHPLVSLVVREKLRFYRWWYVFTFLLYIIFLINLYYALMEASYLCDDMLLSYDTPYNIGRGFCEVVVVIYALVFTFDESLEFALKWYQTHRGRKLIEKADEERALSHAGHGAGKLYEFRRKFRLVERVRNINSLLFHFFSAVSEYIGVLNLIDVCALLSLLFLIILRLSQVPGQWVFASFTFILFSLKLFKYTRIYPSLGAYVRTIVHIFLYDITQFAIIVLIFLLAYFGGIHLAARLSIVEPGAAVSLNGQTCSNQSSSSLFWFDAERTSVYDLRRPLLTGLIFLLDGGPGNEESTLLDSNFLFSLLYLAFAFTIIVVMLNILIAQLSETYSQIIKTSGFHYTMELVVTLEFSSNLAFFFGRKLREFTSIEHISIENAKWNLLKANSPKKDTDLQIEENHERIKRSVKLLEDEKLRGTINHEWVQDKISVMSQNVENALKQNTTLEGRIDNLEGKLERILDLLTART